MYQGVLPLGVAGSVTTRVTDEAHIVIFWRFMTMWEIVVDEL